LTKNRLFPVKTLRDYVKRGFSVVRRIINGTEGDWTYLDVDLVAWIAQHHNHILSLQHKALIHHPYVFRVDFGRVWHRGEELPIRDSDSDEVDLRSCAISADANNAEPAQRISRRSTHSIFSRAF
jgi:hypothetical protein